MRNVQRVPIPATRGPFVNTALRSLGTDASGAEHFWISTWNQAEGCLGVRISETGEHRVYRFADRRHSGFYNAAPEGEQVLWLWGWLDTIVRLDLSSGRWQAFPTGAPRALTFAGMARDPGTGKLFAATFAAPHVEGVVFDPSAGRTVKRLSDFSGQRYMASSFPNGDGTHTVLLACPGLDFIRWDPNDDSLRVVCVKDELVPYDEEVTLVGRLIRDERGRPYIPGRGWFEPQSWRFETAGPRPAKEMCWFGRRGKLAYGWSGRLCADSAVWEWHMDTGAMRKVCEIPDSCHFNVGLTQSGKIVSVNIYGDFHRFDAATGALECARPLDTDAVGAVDCLVRVDEHRLLGTTFISQRFWEVDLSSGEGYDCGRAAPGGGEVLQTWKLDGQVYMASYGGGELMAYDPGRPPRFPENPRVVADPPGGMRPVAAADDGRHIFYACSRKYGQLGAVITRYDTRTGLTRYRADPVPDQQVVSLRYDPAIQGLLFGTTMHADCQSRQATSDGCCFGILDADDLSVRARFPAPEGTVRAVVYGAMGEDRYLCACEGDFPGGTPWFVLDARDVHIPELSAMGRLREEAGGLMATDRPGYFVQCTTAEPKRIELWDMRGQPTCVDVLCDNFEGYTFFVLGEDLYLAMPREMVVIEGALAGHPE